MVTQRTLMNNVLYGETMANLRNRIDIRLASNKKDYLNLTSKPSFILQKMFANDSIAIRKI